MSEQISDFERQIPLRYEYPDDLTSHYSTNYIVQSTENEFILSFFEVFPPPLLGSPEQNKKALEQLDSIPAKCVGRFVLSPAGMRALVGIMQSNLQRFDVQRAMPQEDSE